MIRRIRAYYVLANELEESDAASASVLREIGSKWVKRLAELEDASLARRFNPFELLSYVILVTPAVVGAFYAWTEPGWWTWPTLLLAGFWAVTLSLAAWTTFFGMDGEEPRGAHSVERESLSGRLRNASC
jgi:hypothetical protein